MNVGIETEAAQFLFLGIFAPNLRYCVFAVYGKNYKWSFPNMLGDCCNLWLASRATLLRRIDNRKNRKINMKNCSAVYPCAFITDPLFEIRDTWAQQPSTTYTVKNCSGFPVAAPAGMSLTKLSLARNNYM
jgi:hypothetical protein